MLSEKEAAKKLKTPEGSRNMSHGKTSYCVALVTAVELLLTIHKSAVSATAPVSSVQEFTFTRCASGHVSDRQLLDDAVARSNLDCYARCAMLAGCQGVNVCPSGSSSGGLHCDLLADHASCNGLVSEATSSCFFAQKAQIEPDSSAAATAAGSPTTTTTTVPTTITTESATITTAAAPTSPTTATTQPTTTSTTTSPPSTAATSPTTPSTTTSTTTPPPTTSPTTTTTQSTTTTSATSSTSTTIQSAPADVQPVPGGFPSSGLDNPTIEQSDVPSGLQDQDAMSA